MAEIVGNAVEPDRALADHAFAHRFARRAGTSILVGPGRSSSRPDLSAGVPSDPATRAGRALALQLLGVTLARGDGLRRRPDHRRRPAALADRRAGTGCPRDRRGRGPAAALPGPPARLRRATDRGRSIGPVAVRPGGGGGPRRRRRARPAGGRFRSGRRGPRRARGAGGLARLRRRRAATDAGAAHRRRARARPRDGRGGARDARSPGATRAGGRSPAIRRPASGRGRRGTRWSPSGPRPSIRSRCSCGRAADAGG